MAWYEKGSDDFNRSEDPLSTGWTTFTGYNNLKIASNRCVPTTGTDGHNHAYYDAVSLGNDQYSQFTIINKGSPSPADQHCWGRVTNGGADNYNIYCSFGNGGYRLYKRVSGSSTPLGSYQPTVADNDVVRLSCEGTTIKSIVNTVELDSQTDSAHGSGYAGAGMYGTSNATSIDDFSCGDTSPPAYVVPPLFMHYSFSRR